MPITPEQFEQVMQEIPEVREVLYIHDTYGKDLEDATFVQRLKKYAADNQPVELFVAGVGGLMMGAIDAVNGDMLSLMGAGDELIHVPISAISFVRVFNPKIGMIIAEKKRAEELTKKEQAEEVLGKPKFEVLDNE